MKTVIIILFAIIWILLGFSAVSIQIREDKDGVKCILRSLKYLGIILAGPLFLLGRKS